MGRAKDNITVEGEDKIVSAIETGYSAYLQLISEIKPISISGPRKAATLYHETILPSFLRVREACIRLREINQENMYKVSDRASRIARRAIWSMGIIGIAAAGIGFSLFLSNLLVGIAIIWGGCNLPCRLKSSVLDHLLEGDEDLITLSSNFTLSAKREF